MDHKEAGQGTPFDSMSHEEMLAWLDAANSGAIQGASDRLVSAAKEIREIAEELKVRPQTVEWKGEGADAFRTWSADLANATLRLGAYSEGAAKWLAQASDSLASAQVSIPRTHAGAQANLDAAQAARNDPDASAVARKSAETLIAAKEANRQDAAAEMRKLAQSYALSASQMDGLEKPAFPPPPGAIVPEREGAIIDSETWGAPVGGRGTVEGEGAIRGATTYSASAQATGPGSPGAPDSSAIRAPLHPETSVSMEVNGTATLPQSTSTPSVSPPGLPVAGKPDGGIAPGLTVMPPAFRGGSRPIPGPSGSAKNAGLSVRAPSLPGQSMPGSGSASRTPRGDAGIFGGRPVAQPTARGLPGGTVVGGEGTQGRGPMGHGGMSGGAARGGTTGGRLPAGANAGIVGGRPQQTARSGARPFTPGGTGLVRGNEAGRAAGQAGRGLPAPSGSRPGGPRRDEGGKRPDYLIEDEETWQQGGRRVVPPVIE
ncbi:translation initiation factor IF-2 [Streptomyces sp. NPDC002911]